MTNKRTEYFREYFRTHKIERHIANRKYYYSHKYLWNTINSRLGSLATQKIYESDIEKSKTYIHDYAEFVRNYKSRNLALNKFKKKINNQFNDKRYLNSQIEDDE